MSETNKKNIITTAVACGVTAVAVTSLVLGAVALGKTNAIEVPEVKEEALVGYVEPVGPMTRAEYNEKLRTPLTNFNEMYTISEKSFGSFHLKNETVVNLVEMEEETQGGKTYLVPEERSIKETSDLYVENDKLKIVYTCEDMMTPYELTAQGKIEKGEIQKETSKATIYATFAYDEQNYKYQNYVFMQGETATAPYTYNMYEYYDAFDEDFAEIMMFGFNYTAFFDSMCELSNYYGKLTDNEYEEKDGKLLSKGNLFVNGFTNYGFVTAAINVSSAIDATNFANGSTGTFSMDTIDGNYHTKTQGNFMIEPIKNEDKTDLNTKITTLMGQAEEGAIEENTSIQYVSSYIARSLVAG